MKYNFTSIITKDGAWFVAQCVETGVTTQGKTVISAKKNLRAAVELYLEDLPALRRKKLFKTRAIVAPLTLDYA